MLFFIKVALKRLIRPLLVFVPVLNTTDQFVLVLYCKNTDN